MANYATVARYLKTTLPNDIVNIQNTIGAPTPISSMFGDYSISKTYTNSTENFVKIIDNTLKDIGITNNSFSELSDKTLALYPGDIIIYKYKNVQVPVIVTDISSGAVETYPTIASNVTGELQSTKILRSSAFSNADVLSAIGQLILVPNKELEDTDPNDLISINPNKRHTAGLLKIGDISLLVDPVQISFVTQNGYQYFPTLRTAGDPKIPSLQDIKNISIQLIFPNTDSINHQLIPIYAMFKRTPFVPIYNKDIYEFFKSIIPDSTNYLPIALESINIQSLAGFPNTLQATISVLPFDYRAIGGEFRALSTFNDVALQQDYLNDTSETKIYDQLKSKLYDTTKTNVDSDAYFEYDINHIDDFEQSIPFRVFYQSIIADRSNVLDSLGRTVKTKKNKPIPLSDFRPKKDHNLLFSYNPNSNVNKKISFTYDYINSTDVRSFAKTMNSMREDNLANITSNTRLMLNADQLAQDFTASLTNIQETLTRVTYTIKSTFRILDRTAAYYGINIDAPSSKKVKGMFDLLMLSFFDESIIGQAYSAISNNGPSDQVNFAKSVYNKLLNNQIDISGYKDAYSFAQGLIIEGGTADNPKFYPAETFMKNLVSKITQEIEALTSEDEKKAWTKFITYIAKHLSADIFGSDAITMDIDEVDPSIVNLPLETKTIEINGKDDIVVGWSLTFANKFVPIRMLDFNYPFYQHLGSGDPELSLTIRSMQYSGTGLKDELSRLHDRLLMNIKLVQMNSPELLTYLDPRLTIDIEGDLAGNIFNCFGIRKAVFNGSKVSSVPNQPGSWNISVSLTGANISVADYHSVTAIPTNTSITPEILNLLLRTKFKQGELVCFGYQITPNVDTTLTPDEEEELAAFLGMYVKTSNNTNTISSKNSIKSLIVAGPTTTTLKAKVEGDNIVMPSIDEINTMLIGLNGIQSAYDLFSQFSGSDFNKIADKFKPYMNIIQQVEITEDTAKLRDLISKHSQLGPIIRNIVYRIGDINKREFEFIKSFVDSSFNSTGNIIANVMVISVATMILLLIPGLGALGISLVLALSLSATTTTTLGAGALQQLRILSKDALLSNYNSAIGTVTNIIKTQLISSFASKILKDPYIRNTLATSGLIKDIDVDTNNILGINCYNDFDVPIGIIENLNKNTGIKNFSPDFYLFNKTIPKHELLSYIADTYKNMASIKNIMNMTIFKDKYDVAKSLYDAIGNKLTSIDSALVQQVCGNLSITEKKEVYTMADLDAIGYELKEMYALSIDPASNPMYDMDPDKAKFTIANVALSKRLLELSMLQTALNSATIVNTKSKDTLGIQRKIIDQLNSDNKEARGERGSIDGTLDQLSNSTINEISGRLNTLISMLDPKIDYNSADTKTKLESLKKEVYSKSITQPSLMKFEQHAYTIMQQVMLLNEAIIDYKSTGAPDWQLYNGIPEISMMSWFGLRETESQVQKLKLINILREYYDTSLVGLNAKLFPTFKILFVEEDKGLVQNYDDYYSFDAIQSIDVISNKYTPGKTAIIRLTNVTGTLTNKISMMRDNPLTSGSDNIFLGSLDVKPGTKIIIKVGYASSSKTLKTIFVGRIVEMNNGPQVQLICQSFGSQLNHDITKLKFGLLSTDKEHGDIASAILDTIPGLDGLGKLSTLDVTSDKFTGKNADQYLKSSPMDNFLLSSILGRVSAITYGQDNPRDDNIYLPYVIYSSFMKHPTFDWVVYNQSAWNALQELSLFHKNCYPVVKLYNDDYLSKLDDIRETLIIGDKSGYYKYTDSFPFSTMNVNKIKEAVEKWNSSYSQLKSLALQGINHRHQIENGKSYIFIMGKGTELVNAVENLFNDKLLSTAIIYKLLNNKKIKIPVNLIDIGSILVNSELSKLGIINDIFMKLIVRLSTYNGMTHLSNGDIDSFTLELCEALVDVAKDKDSSILFSDLILDEVLHVDTIISSNTQQILEIDPRYKRIQKQHLITSTSDIISNDIILSQDFNNAVSVYFLSEPKMGDLSDKDINNLRSYTIKAFGDIKDDDIRLLESYQKNIDTNWIDIKSDAAVMFNSYLKQQVRTSDNCINAPFKWDKLPSWHTVGLSLLQREVEKMYRGSIKIIGNPHIDIFDILHIDDAINNMNGPVEVEEVIHSFSPAVGFTTTITPSLITYDRTPQAGNDIAQAKRLYEHSTNWWKLFGATGGATQAGIAAAGIAVTGLIIGAAWSPVIIGASMIGTTLVACSSLYNATLGHSFKYSQAVYDSMATVFGRDCINFNALSYHGIPYMTGFGGVDYTNIKTLINHQVAGLPLMQRLAASTDPEFYWVKNIGKFKMGTLETIMSLTFGPKVTKTLMEGVNTTGWGTK